METLKSKDGRYEIVYHADCTGWATIFEYAGFAPRLEVNRSSVPFEFLAILMDKMLFNVTSTAAITVVSEPHKTELALQGVLS